jgi:hypothetical protein
MLMIEVKAGSKREDILSAVDLLDQEKGKFTRRDLAELLPQIQRGTISEVLNFFKKKGVVEVIGAMTLQPKKELRSDGRAYRAAVAPVYRKRKPLEGITFEGQPLEQAVKENNVTLPKSDAAKDFQESTRNRSYRPRSNLKMIEPAGPVDGFTRYYTPEEIEEFQKQRALEHQTEPEPTPFELGMPVEHKDSLSETASIPIVGDDWEDLTETENWLVEVFAGRIDLLRRVFPYISRLAALLMIVDKIKLTDIEEE